MLKNHNTTQPCSRKSLETAIELLNDLVEGSSDVFTSFFVMADLASREHCPIDGQRMEELKSLSSAFQRMLFDERANLQFQLAQLSGIAEAEKLIKNLGTRLPETKKEEGLS